MSRNRYLALIVLIFLPCLYFYPAVFGQVVLMPGDGWTQIYGLRVLIGQMLAQGQLPLWNPFIFAGMPLMASIQVGAFFPLTWAFALLPPFVAMNVMVILTYHIALIGSYFYARSISLTRLASLFTGASFTFGSFMLCHLGHTNRIAAAAWLPWILLAIEKLYQQAQWRWVVLGALFIALQLFAGDPQITAYTILLSVPYWLFSIVLREQKQNLLKRIIYTASFGIGGFLLSAIQLLPDAEMLGSGERARISYEYFSLFAIPPQQIFGLIFPYFFGGATTSPYSIYYWGKWNYVETSLYAGLLPLGFFVIALWSERKNRLVWFWVGVAVFALLLSFGPYLPFGINQLLYQVPIYNLFRAHGRHTLEIIFAIAVLGGIGLTTFAMTTKEKRIQLAWLGIATLSLLVIITSIAYLFFGNAFTVTGTRVPEAGQITNAEFLVPVCCAALGIIGIFVYARYCNHWGAAILLFALLIDLAMFGQFFEWRIVQYDQFKAQIGDAPTVTFLKQRDPNWHTFRIAGRAMKPYLGPYALLNYPNVSIGRGLQSVNGYDPLFLTRTAAIAGNMDLDGIPQEKDIYGSEHQGFNLLNVKYLLHDIPRPEAMDISLTYEGVPFATTPLSLNTKSGDHFVISLNKTTASELAIISTLAHSVDVADNTPMLKFKLYTADGKVIERELLAGRDTAEWAHDRAEVKEKITHRRAPIVDSWDVENYQGHRYLARLKFDRAEITRIEIDHVNKTGDCLLFRASLFDADTKAVRPIDNVDLPPERWKKISTFGSVEIYENLQHLPRAWLVKELVVEPNEAILKIIKTGLIDANTKKPFDPRQTALLALEDFGGRDYALPKLGDVTNPQVHIPDYNANHLSLETDNPTASFLVLSEIYFRDWEAYVDGRKQTIYRVNHTLRGLSLSGGKHRIEFHYRPQSFYNGMRLTAGGILFLVLGAFLSQIYQTRKLRSVEAQ